MANPEDAGTTKSVERLLAEKESIRKSHQEAQKMLDERERELKELRAQLQSRDSGGEGLDEDKLKSLIKSTVSEALTERDAQVQEEQGKVLAFQAKHQEWLLKAYTEFPGAKDQGSELTNRAREIFLDPLNELSVFEGGRIMPSRPSADYDAYARASVELARKGQQRQEATEGATFVSSGGGASGTTPVPAGTETLSDEEFLKMTTEQQKKWQREQANSPYRT